MLPLLQHSDKLIEPVPFHLSSLPEGLHFRSLCLPTFLFWGVREPGVRVEGRGHVKFKDRHIPIQWQEGLAMPASVYQDVASGAWFPARVKWLPFADGP